MTTRTFTVPSQSQLQRQRGIYRVQFCELQRLRAADLRDEQTFRLGLRRRHHLQPHDWGIVVGLAPRVQSDDSKAPQKWLEIQPGVAIDGYGREIVVAEPMIVDLQRLERWWKPAPSAQMELWLRYHVRRMKQLIEPDVTREHYVEHAQLYPRLVKLKQTDANVLITDTILTNTELPGEVYPATHGVFLGTVTLSNSDLTVDLAGRRYTEAYAGNILSPTGYVRMLLAPEEPFDARRFSIGTRTQNGSYKDNLIIGSSTLDTARGPRIQNRIQLRGTLAVNLCESSNQDNNEPVVFAGQPLVPDQESDNEQKPDKAFYARLIHLDPFAEIPKVALPWRIYCAPITIGDSPETQRKINELRIEMFNPGKEGFPDMNRVAIGRWNEGAFESLLTVTADGTVVVDGKLNNTEIVIVKNDIDPNLAQLAEILDQLGQVITTTQGMTITITAPRTRLQNLLVKPSVTVTNTSNAALTSINLQPLVVSATGSNYYTPRVIQRLAIGASETVEMQEFTVSDLGTYTVLIIGSATLNRSTVIKVNATHEIAVQDRQRG